MVWASSKNELRESPRKAFEHENKREMPERETRSRWEELVRKDVTLKGARMWNKWRRRRAVGRQK
jgi:hypothetical protein